MPISWNEIKTRAIAFSKEWEQESSEDAEAKSFWDDFFNVFGISRRRVAAFEQSVRKQDGKQGFIDLLWKGVILVEHKSKGKNLDKAFQQAKDYFPGLKEHELPRYILVSDFQTFRLYDLDNLTQTEFLLKNFVQNVHLFGFIAGYEQRTYKEQDPANIEAAERMGKLHDALEASGYTGHALEVYLVRLLFCLFAEDTSIFERTLFQEYIDKNTKADGSDLALHLAQLFQVLNTPKERRLKTLDENIAAFPYVNGKLFEEVLPIAAFDAKMREMLLLACGLDWSRISPAIFGAMFQAVMNPKERRNLGAHYTSEKNILKVIKPLFLDELHAELENARGNRNKINELHKKIANLRFLDPACGCGNFLIIAYRELRLLEIEILRELNKTGQGFLDVRDIIRVDVDQFAGIEYDEFPARIAEVAMWLCDHQMNMLVSEAFGQYFVRLPLSKAAKILHTNALRIDWNTIFQNQPIHYIFGNPPFVGERYQSEQQRNELELVFGEVVKLDYVSAWYLIASKYIQNTKIKVCFVSTNSIVQGEQTSILWGKLMNTYNIQIHFAHRTFKWNNEAKGNAAVYCVIIGFSSFNIEQKYLFDYQDIKGEPTQIKVQNINPYLVDAKNTFIHKQSKPICNVPVMQCGSRANDRGLLLFTEAEKEEFIKYEPTSKEYFKQVVGAQEFINNIKRYALWLENINPSILKNMTWVLKRVAQIKEHRNNNPHLFGSIRKPTNDFLFIPQMSSENRDYIPIGFLNKDIIPLDPHFFIDKATLFLFGILTSKMHNCWVRYVCGRLKSDLRYSNSIVYNNYPFPQNVSEAHKKKVEQAAEMVLTVRGRYAEASLADLYDPLSMPPDLVKAHQNLDKAVDLCYRPQAFVSELGRIEFLFNLYEQYSAPMFRAEKGKKKR